MKGICFLVFLLIDPGYQYFGDNVLVFSLWTINTVKRKRLQFLSDHIFHYLERITLGPIYEKDWEAVFTLICSMAGIKRKSWWFITIFHFYRTDNPQRLKKSTIAILSLFQFSLQNIKLLLVFQTKWDLLLICWRVIHLPPTHPLIRQGNEDRCTLQCSCIFQQCDNLSLRCNTL